MVQWRMAGRQVDNRPHVQDILSISDKLGVCQPMGSKSRWQLDIRSLTPATKDTYFPRIDYICTRLDVCPGSCWSPWQMNWQPASCPADKIRHARWNPICSTIWNPIGLINRRFPWLCQWEIIHFRPIASLLAVGIFQHSNSNSNFNCAWYHVIEAD